jgi:hypothetical protein
VECWTLLIKINRSALKYRRLAASTLLCFTLLGHLTAAMAQEATNSEVIVAHGVLSRTDGAGTLWILRAGNSPKFRDETILEVTFTTEAGEASESYIPYDGKYVELTGEVKSTFRGNAVLSKIRTIGILQSPVSYITGGVGAPAPSTAVSSGGAKDRIPYKHAYYLFLSGVPKGCEACYVPLLITQHSLDEIASGKHTVHCVFISTFERDSIWEIRGVTPIDPAAIEVSPRIVHIGPRSYRYQEISPSEVLKLLKEPLGTIPISRPYIVNKLVPGASVSELASDFSALKPEVHANQN